jgi:DNA-binding NtrC family response regulator
MAEGKQLVQVAEKGAEERRKTILIVSPDPNFCMSLSMLFGDRYHVRTVAGVSALEEACEGPGGVDLVLVDEGPSRRLVDRLLECRRLHPTLPVIMLYVYSPKDMELDSLLRGTADAVYYKPFEITAVSRRVDDLLSVH